MQFLDFLAQKIRANRQKKQKKKSKHRTGQTLYKVFLVVGGFKVRNDGG